ncbi:MAG: hypothetical protein ACFE9Z_12240 [Promethearchaeota archaeon]
MSDEELRDQINKIAVEIEKIEQVAKQKEVYITNRINQEFIPKMSTIELNLQNQRAILNEYNNQIDDLMLKKKELAAIVKNLEKEYNNLKKEKDKFLNEQMKAIIKEKQTKTKIVDRQIKILEKELKASREQ